MTFDYEAEDETNITISVGDVVVVTDKSDADWWEGHLEGKADAVGFFPASFVELIEDVGAVGGVGTNADTTEFAQGDLSGTTIHTGDGAGGTTITIQPGTTYVVVMEIDECIPTANSDHILLFTVDSGGSTYEELQYGSSPTVGDAVV